MYNMPQYIVKRDEERIYPEPGCSTGPWDIFYVGYYADDGEFYYVEKYHETASFTGSSGAYDDAKKKCLELNRAPQVRKHLDDLYESGAFGRWDDSWDD